MPRPKSLSISELNALLPRIKATVELYTGGAARASSPAVSSTGNGRRDQEKKSTRTRAGASAMQTALLATLAGAKKGLSLGDILKKAGGSRTAVKYHLRVLRKHKRAKVTGDRRQARWFSV